MACIFLHYTAHRSKDRFCTEIYFMPDLEKYMANGRQMIGKYVFVEKKIHDFKMMDLKLK